MDTKRNTRAILSHGDGKSLLQSLFFSLPLMLLIGGAAVLLASLLVFQAEDPSAYVALGGYGALAATALLSGLAAGRMHRRRGWLAGALLGVLLVLIQLSVAALTPSEGGVSVLLSTAIYTTVFLLSLFGGVLGGARRVSRRRRRR